MIITKELIELGMSDNGGYNREQLIILGVLPSESKKFIIPKGWKNRLIGSNISKDDYDLFVSYKNFKNKTNNIVFIKPDKNLEWSEQYKHPNWQKVRLKVLQRDNFSCTRCGNRHLMLHVHHLKYESCKYVWEIPLYFLTTLCENCHEEEHNKKFN